jgi:hypothetical protein
MKRNVMIAVLLAGVVMNVGLGGEYLTRIRLATPEQAGLLAGQGVRVLAVLNDGGLALLEDYELAGLAPSYSVEVLDVDPQTKLYFIVTSRGTGRTQTCPDDALEALGTVLWKGRAALLRTTEDKVLELNRLPVELTRLSMTPMTRSGEDVAASPIESRPIADSLVARIVAQVSSDSVLATIRRLQKFYTRYSSTDSCRAAVNYMLSRLRAYRCDTAFGHVYRSSYAPNAVGVKYGRVNPRRMYIICGHIDNTSDQPPNRCPGSDDNGSGTTAALEAARVFADYDFDYTVKFIGFTGEEQGLFGSDSFSAQSYRRHDTILGVLNFDMISYGRQNRDSLIITGRTTSPNCRPLVDAYCANADTYTDLKYVKDMISSGGYGSDHYYFWQRGYLALWGEENDFTPMYHTIGDTIGPLYYTNCGTNNVGLCTEGIKAAVATLAKLAGAYQMTGQAGDGRPWSDFRLAQNRPNPFRYQTSISFVTAGPVAIRVYDRGGRLVRELAGHRTVQWDGRDLTGRRVAPGVYFYRIEGTQTSEFRKAVLLEE